MTWLLSPWLGIPRWIYAAALAVAAGIVVAGVKMHDARVARQALEADRSAANAAAVSTARQADERAHEAANRTTEAITDANERAKAAADSSDDPLADGLRSLRRSNAG